MSDLEECSSTLSLSSSLLTTLPVVDIDSFFHRTEELPVNPSSSSSSESTYITACKTLSSALHEFGAVLVHDSRIDDSENQRFQDMMELYFAQSDGIKDARPEWAYQVGVTPSGTEKARGNIDLISKLPLNERPLTKLTPEFDKKMRFFWRIGPAPKRTSFPTLNMPPVKPEGFPDWEITMNNWGNKLMGTLFVVSEMAATGFGLPPDAFSSRLEYGPHLLAPTGSNLAQCKVGDVLAGFHSDLNFLTIHGAFFHFALPYQLSE